MDCTAHGVAKSQIQLSDFHFTSLGPSRDQETPQSVKKKKKKNNHQAWELTATIVT